jgi:hypothetical protein
MLTPVEHAEYLAELREPICSHCIQRGPDCPPCAPPHGRPCGIEAHLVDLVEICRTTDTAPMASYIEKLHDLVCPTCEYKDSSACPCPLNYLLQLAVEAIEAVESRRP